MDKVVREHYIVTDSQERVQYFSSFDFLAIMNWLQEYQDIIPKDVKLYKVITINKFKKINIINVDPS